MSVQDSPLTLKSFEIISTAGTAKSMLMEAMRAAKEGDFVEAEKQYADAQEMIIQSHHIQTALLQAEAGGETNEIGLISVHAQDHLMTTMLLKDMMSYIIELYKRTAE